jgi:microtubule-associated protein-like 5
MGNFIQYIVAQGDLKTTVPLINRGISNIRELHGGFKSVCDNFAMNLTEFETVFNSNEKIFAVWDTDNNGLIDALELFAGLITFADSKAEDKLRFLFDLYDFNEI